jgi:anaerobic selenocysteine-containing dehydrogenase
MGFSDECLKDSDEEIARQGRSLVEIRRLEGMTLDELKLRLAAPQRLRPFAPFANGNFLTPSGKCEFFSESLARQGWTAPTYTPPRESRQTAPRLAERFPLAIISLPPTTFSARAFANLPSFIHREGADAREIHPEDASSRESRRRPGARLQIGASLKSGSVSHREGGRGVVVAL